MDTKYYILTEKKINIAITMYMTYAQKVSIFFSILSHVKHFEFTT